jgi:hypothetical protein
VRRLLVIVTVAVALAALPAAAVAARPGAGCGAAASGFQLVDRDGLWADTVIGFADDGLAVYDQQGAFTAEFEAFAVNHGFADAAALKDWVMGAHWAPYDKNGDGYLCMKDLPNTPGIPGYSFGLTDNTAHID